MNDAARSWISPYCTASVIPETSRIMVWVLNPGGPDKGSAEVTVRIYGSFGILQGTPETRTIEPMHSARFGSVQAEDAWCHIESDKPVFPWGITAWVDHGAPDFEGFPNQGVVDMTFYRHEVTPISILQDFVALIYPPLKR